MRKTIILGGGTFEPIRNHLSLSAPAFGTTAIKLSELIPNSELILTRMANRYSNLITNEDVEKYIDILLDDIDVGTIILNIAFCDFKSLPIDDIDCGLHSERLKTINGNLTIELEPTSKIISKIRIKRPDIFLVGFKTTTNKSSDEQFLIALQMMKSTKCNLVLANDTVTRNNMIITPEETIYHETTNRDDVLKGLSEMVQLRSNLTYNPTEFIKANSKMLDTNTNFSKIIDFLINNGGFIENNGNGFTPGHFCIKIDSNKFLSSQRKANHNLVFREGVSLVEVIGESNNEIFKVTGDRKASVGARSQWLALKDNPDYDCIIHTHNPLKIGSLINVVPQRHVQCGSIECGLSTLGGMVYNQDIDSKVVFLDKHGINILFKSSTNPSIIIDFIKDNIELGVKVK